MPAGTKKYTKRWSPAQLAELWGITPRRVYQLSERDIIPKSEKGRYDLVGSTQAYVKFLKAGAESKRPQKLAEGVKKAQKEKLEEEAKLLKIKREVQEGRLIFYDEVKEVFGQILNGIRGRLDNFSKSVAARANPSDHQTAQKAIEEAIYSILAQIAKAEARGDD